MAKDDIKAIKFIAERAYGKTPIEHSGADGTPIQIVCGFALPQWAQQALVSDSVVHDDSE